ncbi:hypothetical protein EBR78_11825 [bacterium]|nr:hypothetical protein [bacterium]NBX81566.1 hypothetical protein [bacterium]
MIPEGVAPKYSQASPLQNRRNGGSMKNKISALFLAIYLGVVGVSNSALADCIIDEGPYQDDYGFAVFPFYNQCDLDFTISLCVKSVPPGSDTAVFNRYSARAYGRGPVAITGGKWDAFYSYRWDADNLVECPYSE